MRRLLAVLVLCVSAAGCASAPVQREVQRQVVVPGATFDRTWDAVIDIFGERNWTIANMERASGFINSDWMRTSPGEGFLDCGSPGIAIESDHRGRFNIVVREAPDRSGVSLTVNTTWQADRRFGDTYGAVDCVSTGELERTLHEDVMQRARG